MAHFAYVCLSGEPKSMRLYLQFNLHGSMRPRLPVRNSVPDICSYASWLDLPVATLFHLNCLFLPVVVRHEQLCRCTSRVWFTLGFGFLSHQVCFCVQHFDYTCFLAERTLVAYWMLSSEGKPRTTDDRLRRLSNFLIHLITRPRHKFPTMLSLMQWFSF